MSEKAKPFSSAEFKQMQLLLKWNNETTAAKLGVNLKTVVNWRAGTTRLPCYLRQAMSYFLHIEGMKP